ncbi:Zn(II)2Cys6 transcription factor [Aspergillus lucknowensis]|uniref:Fungal-specific transcription factor domain-containing protein n=1 Tax=Aspergillus lucknowensis TaxID=176173 RepID=A0ABR4LZD9_9EURO
MPKSRNRRSELDELRACLKAKKAQCSGTNPCTYCTRANKPCVFGQRPSRTPLTRKNLNAAELRCSNLVSLFRKIHPDIDIEDALQGVGNDVARYSLRPSEVHQTIGPYIESPDTIHDYEWNEASAAGGLPDGMVSLPSARADSGYLGTSSGTRLLENIPDLLQERPRSQQRQEPISPPQSNQLGSPSLLLHFADTAIMGNLVDAYFLWYNKSYPILHESIFRERYRNRQQLHASSNWYVIFYLVLAIGHWISTERAETGECRYYMAAKSRMSMQMLESGNLPAVQAFLLMGNYLQKRDRPNTGYNYIGMAYRIALGLGLHREPRSEVGRNNLLNEQRRAVWWIVYVFDSGFGLTTGRPVMASDSFIETRLPLNIDDSVCTLESPLPAPANHPTTYSAIVALARLASIANTISSDILSATNNRPFDLKTPRSIDQQLRTWKLSLPAYFTTQDVPDWFRGPRAVVRWKEQNLRMLLWWGSQRLSRLPPEREEALNLCYFSAVESIQDVTTFCMDHPNAIHAGLSWYATYFLFQAIVVLSIHHLQPLLSADAAPTMANEGLWVSSISRARECLGSLAQTNRAATRCLSVLDRIQKRTESGGPEGPQAEYQPGAVNESSGGIAHPTHLAIDPTLHMLFEDATWESDLFEGLHGFPGTDEMNFFDYAAANAATI